MTESDWDTCADPMAMLTFLVRTGGVSDRKYRLFACACCRRVWDRFPDERTETSLSPRRTTPMARPTTR
jgi:hypothetical protein